MNRNLTICFTSDIHGYFSDMDYATGTPGTTGLSRCAFSFPPRWQHPDSGRR
ncbi:MAG: hypothetical protein ACLTR8_01075 [Oscillospiraceae bacterium]